MSVIVKHIPHTVDLNEPVKKTYIDTLLATEDNLAHCFDITMKQGVPSGAAVNAYFIRYSDNATISLTGTVNGNVASVTLNKSCYNKAGQYAVIIKVVADGVTNTVFYGEGTIFTSVTDTILDPENVVPSLSDLLAQIAAMEAGTAAANTATNRANAAANRCEQMQIDASGMAGDSNKLGGKAPEYYTNPHNLLRNSNFANPVNTGGFVSGSGVEAWGGEIINEWLAYAAGATVTLTNSGISLLNSIYQEMEATALSRYAGKQMTFAAKIGGIVYATSGVFEQTGAWHIVGEPAGTPYGSIRFEVQNDNKLFCVIINDTEALIEWAALYEGAYTADNVPPHVPKGYANELLACEVAEDGKAPWKNIIWESPARTLTLAPDVEIEFNIENCADPTKLIPFAAIDQTYAKPIVVSNWWKGGTTLYVRLSSLSESSWNNASVKVYCINLGAF